MFETVFCLCDNGTTRKKNEDRLFVHENTHQYYVYNTENVVGVLCVPFVPCFLSPEPKSLLQAAQYMLYICEEERVLKKNKQI